MRVGAEGKGTAAGIPLASVMVAQPFWAGVFLLAALLILVVGLLLVRRGMFGDCGRGRPTPKPRDDGRRVPRSLPTARDPEEVAWS